MSGGFGEFVDSHVNPCVIAHGWWWKFLKDVALGHILTTRDPSSPALLLETNQPTNRPHVRGRRSPARRRGTARGCAVTARALAVHQRKGDTSVSLSLCALWDSLPPALMLT